VELRVDGFSDKLPVLAARLVECAARCEVRLRPGGGVVGRPNGIPVPSCSGAWPPPACPATAASTPPPCTPPKRRPALHRAPGAPLQLPARPRGAVPQVPQRQHVGRQGRQLRAPLRAAGGGLSGRSNGARGCKAAKSPSCSRNPGSVARTPLWRQLPGCPPSDASRPLFLPFPQSNVWHVDAVSAAMADITGVEEVKVGALLGDGRRGAGCLVCLAACRVVVGGGSPPLRANASPVSLPPRPALPGVCGGVHGEQPPGGFHPRQHRRARRGLARARAARGRRPRRGAARGGPPRGPLPAAAGGARGRARAGGQEPGGGKLLRGGLLPGGLSRGAAWAWD
jgi:hypothetical protein